MTITDIHQMTLSGEVACLDFVNSGLETDHVKVERLHHYDDLLVLTERLKLMRPVELLNLRKIAAADPDSASRCLGQALNLREALYQILNTIANSGSLEIDEKYLSIFNAWRGEALAAQVFSISDNRLKLGFSNTGGGLVQPLWIFVLSANELLEKANLEYVRKCSGCDWLFYDKSKNHRRKWCDMQSCGSSVKAKRYYQRKKASVATKD
ncbi:MAG: CGNR zinc finger domain-containing protein [Sphingobacteriaceae bacterium]